jgi:hypothetical protein
MEFVVNKVAKRRGFFLQVLWFSPVNYRTTDAALSFICRPNDRQRAHYESKSHTIIREQNKNNTLMHLKDTVYI